jgi:hypothetical protein
MTQEALKLALEFLEDNQHFIETYERPEYLVMYNDAIDKCKEALAQEQEPVAWMHVQGNYKEPSFRELADDEVERGWEQYPLYTSPPQRTWVGLTPEQFQKCVDGLEDLEDCWKAIETELKQKNGYAEEE